MTEGKTPVLFLSYDGLTDPLGRSQILPYLCGLSAKGFLITILSFEKPDRFVQDRDQVRVLCSQHQLEWNPLVYHKHPPVASTLYDLFQLRKWAWRLQRQKRFSIVHCRSYITSLVGVMMKRRFGTKFIFDMRGFWADERVEGGSWNSRNPVFQLIYSYFKKKEKQFIQEADCIISLTENGRSEILRWNLNGTIEVIPCCVDVDHFDPATIDETKRKNLRDELGIREGEFVLLYLGSLGTWYLVEEMLVFFSELKKVRTRARFLIVTLDKLDLTNHENRQDIIVRHASREQVPLFISLADAAVVFIKPSFSKRASSATKMAEVLAMGKPVITNTGWGDISIFKNVLPGLMTVSTSGDYSSVVKSWPQNVNVASIRGAAIKKFSLSMGISLYLKVYQNLIQTTIRNN